MRSDAQQLGFDDAKGPQVLDDFKRFPFEFKNGFRIGWHCHCGTRHLISNSLCLVSSYLKNGNLERYWII